MIGNRATMKQLGTSGGLLPPRPKPTHIVQPASGQVLRKTIQRNPLQGAIGPYLKQLALTAQKIGPVLGEKLEGAKERMGEFGSQVKDTVVEKGGQLKDTVVEKGGQLKDKAMYEYDMYQAKKKYKKKYGSGDKDDEKGLKAKIKNFKKYAFGSDFTFEYSVVDNLEDMPAGMGALQLQIHEIGRMKDSLTTAYRQSKGEDRKKYYESLQEIEQKRMELQQKLSDQMRVYGEIQRQAVEDMQKEILANLPDDVKQAAQSDGMDPTSTDPLIMQAVLDLFELMHPIDFRRVELTARQKAYANVDPSLIPMRNTAEGQLLSDTNKAFTQESLDEMWMDQQKKEKKEEKQENIFQNKIELGRRARRGEKITDEMKEEANEGKKRLPSTQPTPPQVNTGGGWTVPTVPTGTRQRSGGISLGSRGPQPPQPQNTGGGGGGGWQTGTPQTNRGGMTLGGNRGGGWTRGTVTPQTDRGGLTIGGNRGSTEKEKGPQETDKITKDVDDVTDILKTVSKVTKMGGKPVSKLVTTISGGTQDDEGLVKAIPSVPALAAEITDTVASVMLITDGNSAQKKLGQKKLKDNIFKIFKGVAKVTRSTLKVVEQFQLTEAEEALGTTTALTDLGVPIVGIITNTAMMVKAGIDAGIQGKLSSGYKDLGKEAKGSGDEQQIAMTGALKHGEDRSATLMKRAIGDGVVSGLALIGDILIMTGVAASAGLPVKMIVGSIRKLKKVGEKLHDSYNTGKELESRYKARLGMRGSETEVFERSGKYASTALLKRALDGDPVSVKAVKQHGINEKMLQDIRDGKVLFVQARDLIMHDWKEKDKPKTIGMTIKSGLDKVSKALAKLTEEKEAPKEQYFPEIQHLGSQPFPQDMPQQPEEDWDNPTDYEEPEVKKGKLETIKDELKGVGKKVGGGIKKIPGAIKGAPGKIGSAIGKQYNYNMKLAVLKYKFVKVVKDAVQYGGETRKGNWVINRILSKDSDVDTQFERAKQIIGTNEIFSDNPGLQVELATKLMEIMTLEMELKQKYGIYDKPEEDKDKEPWMY